MSEQIDIRDLTRRYTTKERKPGFKGWFEKPSEKSMVAVDKLSFQIGAGAKVAFIGPNGAGKSTTLKMLSGLLRPTEGTATVCGLVPWDQTQALSRKIGLVFGQRSHLWPALSVRDSFSLLQKIYDIEPAAFAAQQDRLVEIFGLRKLLAQPARTLSLGQRMRCDIAAALLHKPDVLFLDEPTIGLDVTAKALLRDHLNLLAREAETTILLTSHDMDDVERICEHVILIDRGQKLLDRPLIDLRAEYTHDKTLRLITEDETPDFDHPAVKITERSDHQIVMRVDVRAASIESVVSACLEKFKIQDISIESIPLEDVIKTLYEKQARRAS